MDRSVKQPGTGLDEWKELIAVGVAGTVGLSTYASLQLGEILYGAPDQAIPVNPISLGLNLATGDVAWTGAATGGAVTLLAGAGALAAGCRKCAGMAGRLRSRKEPIDERAKFMARGKELSGLSRKAVAATAARLNVQLGENDEPGVLIGRSVVGSKKLYASYEDLHLDIWGPRSGKTTSRVIPAVMEAVGPAVVTSNKRDVVDATEGPRSTYNRRTHVFDPQGVAGKEPTWFWDPMTWVLGDEGGAGAQERAAELAGHFAAGGEASAKDAFFDPEGEDLLAGLFLAAALAKKPITSAFEWVTRSHDDEPVHILTEHRFPMVAAALSDQYTAPEKQRSGIFSTAKKMAACLKYEAIRPWVTPPQKGERPRTSFDVAEFVTSRDTLYPLSKEGVGSAGPLITALCAAVADAAEKEGVRHGGRLPVPLTMILDEAANIVKWANLPKQYSHFGSRGMVVMTILQSWAQGERCWGHDGMRALWSAANVKVLGAGLDDAGFLRDRAEIIGDHYERTVSSSRSNGGRSYSISRTTEKTLTPSDLAALPKGRIVVSVSGHRPTLAVAVPWMDRPYADQIDKAIRGRGTGSGTRLHLVPPIDKEGE
ncbi:type IV secretory system conjugative DNA transfer family protein [Nocardia carnea]|uniref:type IV secretory system conjugative DNA transfer family protein n=1 Tax=Nocardia carnea TaxID=37328 RepID=UPI002453D8B4|nr:TraM recognition domain-containing protein [Nocardia carnea]